MIVESPAYLILKFKITVLEFSVHDEQAPMQASYAV